MSLNKSKNKSNKKTKEVLCVDCKKPLGAGALQRLVLEYNVPERCTDCQIKFDDANMEMASRACYPENLRDSMYFEIFWQYVKAFWINVLMMLAVAIGTPWAYAHTGNAEWLYLFFIFLPFLMWIQHRIIKSYRIRWNRMKKDFPDVY